MDSDQQRNLALQPTEPLVSTTLIPFESVVMVGAKEATATCIMLHAGVLYSIARQAAQDMQPSDDPEANRGALTSIMMAAASAETFLNELSELASVIGVGPNQKLLAAFGELVAMNRASTSAMDAWYAAKYLLSGDLYDRGADPFQSFQLLVQLRNHLAHLRPSRVTGSSANTGTKLLEALRVRGMATRPTTNFVHHLMDARVARFACNAARAIILDLGGAFPFARFGTTLVTVLPGESAPAEARLSALFPACDPAAPPPG